MNKIKPWRNAATLIVAARSNQNTYKVLMLKRSAKSSFMPNAYVFPGGVTSSIDFTQEWNHLFQKNKYDPLNRLSNLINLPNEKKPLAYSSFTKDDGLAPELAFRICALRETFEESGILLVRDISGKSIVLDDPKYNIGGKFGTLEGWRDKVNEDAKYFLDIFRHLKISPNVCSLIDWSTWLTPVFPKSKRFDTLFYICFIDDVSIHGKDCGGEVTGIDWLSTSNVPTNSAPPQMYEYWRMLRYKTFEELKSFAEKREAFGLTTWCPFKVSLLDGFMITYPGDDYHNTDPLAESTEVNATLEDVRNNSNHVNRIEMLNGKIMTIENNIEWCGHQPVSKMTEDNFNPIER